MMHLPVQKSFRTMQSGTRRGNLGFIESGCVTVKLESYG